MRRWVMIEDVYVNHLYHSVNEVTHERSASRKSKEGSIDHSLICQKYDMRTAMNVENPSNYIPTNYATHWLSKRYLTQ